MFCLHSWVKVDSIKRPVQIHMMSPGNVTHRQTSHNYFQFSESAAILGNKKICPVAGFVRVARHVIRDCQWCFLNSFSDFFFLPSRNWLLGAVGFETSTDMSQGVYRGDAFKSDVPRRGIWPPFLLSFGTRLSNCCMSSLSVLTCHCQLGTAFQRMSISNPSNLMRSQCPGRDRILFLTPCRPRDNTNPAHSENRCTRRVYQAFDHTLCSTR